MSEEGYQHQFDNELTTTAARTRAASAVQAARTRDQAAAREATTTRWVLRAAVLDALAAGISESETARLAGVTRMTIRAWRRGVGD